MKVRSFNVGVRGRDWCRTVHATSAGKAKAEYHRDVTESWPDVKYTDVFATLIGAPVTDDRFMHNAEYRGIEFARIGMRVVVGDKEGVIVGHNSSANLNVLFPGDQVLNCHPNHRITYFDDAGNVIKRFE